MDNQAASGATSGDSPAPPAETRPRNGCQIDCTGDTDPLRLGALGIDPRPDGLLPARTDDELAHKNPFGGAFGRPR
jgi:hypothetical protein